MSLIALLLLASCNDYEVNPIGDPSIGGPLPEIEVTPREISFAGLPEGQSDTDLVFIRNIGGSPLHLDGWSVDGVQSFTIIQPDPVEELGPDEETTLIVEYTPLTMNDNARLRVFSDDAGQPVVPVDLVGSGLTPRLEIIPSPIEFPVVYPGQHSEAAATLYNPSGVPTHVAGIELTGFEFSILGTPPTTFDVPSGGSAQLMFTYEPPGIGQHAAELRVHGDFEGGVVDTFMRGSCVGDPVAVCSVNPSEIIAWNEEATWRGGSSYDPAGRPIIDYDWTLISRPLGSSAAIPGPAGTPNRQGFIADLAGEYVGRLIVTNDQGLTSPPCEATLEAIIEQDLWIEMFWTTPGDDMDLHLVAPGGTLETGTDCYFGNCVGSGLPWGSGGAQDDPVLDFDDIPGTGPENINIYDPSNGVFQVYVHDYPGSVYQPAQDVTVRIYVDGSLEWVGTKSIQGEDVYVLFAEIDWPAGVVYGM